MIKSLNAAKILFDDALIDRENTNKRWYVICLSKGCLILIVSIAATKSCIA